MAVKKVPQPAHSQSYREPRTLNLERGRWQPPRSLSHSRTAGDPQTTTAVAALACIPFAFSLLCIQGTPMLVLATDLA